MVIVIWRWLVKAQCHIPVAALTLKHPACRIQHNLRWYPFCPHKSMLFTTRIAYPCLARKRDKIWFPTLRTLYISKAMFRVTTLNKLFNCLSLIIFQKSIFFLKTLFIDRQKLRPMIFEDVVIQAVLMILWCIYTLYHDIT